jgi:hypothetical protein
LLWAGLSACGGSSTKCGSDCKPDASPGDAQRDTPDGRVGDGDGSSDAQADAAKAPTGPTDGAVACDQTIATACAAAAVDAGAFRFHCAATLSATTSNTYFCSRPQTTVLAETCGSAHELIDTNGSDEYIYLFDSSGKLTAISYSAAGGSHCVAGPTSRSFVAPVVCSSPTAFSCTAP